MLDFLAIAAEEISGADLIGPSKYVSLIQGTGEIVLMM